MDEHFHSKDLNLLDLATALDTFDVVSLTNSSINVSLDVGKKTRIILIGWSATASPR